MKILLTNHFPLEGSGSGIYTQNVALELTELGHDVTCITPANELATAAYPFAVKTVTFQSEDGDLPTPDMPFNFPCFTTHPRSNQTYYDLSGAQIDDYRNAFQRAIDAHIDSHGCDFIHAQHLWSVSTCAARTGIPMVVTCHGTDLMGYERDPRFHADVAELIDRTGGVVCISEQVHADALAKVGVPPAKAHLIHNGFNGRIFNVADLDRDAVLNDFCLPTEGTRHVVTFVGKLTDFKGVDDLIRAAGIYEKELPGTITLIIGFGQLYDDLQSLCVETGATGVHFLGHQPQTEVARLYNIADLSVVPSRIEPFGLVAIEALATGTPVVATNAGGLPDFINDKVGALVPMNAPIDLAQAIVTEVKAGTKSSKGPYAAGYATEKHSWSVQVRKMAALYQNVLAGTV
jgi:glycosyltransferase involved in cell wall biosynthesis